MDISLKKKNDVESHFNNNDSHNARGQFVFRLPLCESPKKLSNSCSMAVQWLFNLERKQIKNNYLLQEYNKFMYEYLSLGHMKVVSPDQ